MLCIIQVISSEYFLLHTYTINVLTQSIETQKLVIVKDSVANTLFFVVVCLILQPDGEYLCVNLYKKVANLDFIQYVAGKVHF